MIGGAPSITVICATKRPHFIPAFFETLKRQEGVNWRSVIALHGISSDHPDVVKLTSDGRISILQFSEKETLGGMLNVAVYESETPYVCKMDDDDMYGRFFLHETLAALEGGKGVVVGKASWHVWVERLRSLYLMYKGNDHRNSTYLAGGTLGFSRELGISVPFPPVNIGEDRAFLKRIQDLGLPLWSTSRFNYVYVRRGSIHGHAWELDADAYVRGGVHIADRVSPELFEGE